MKKNIRLMKTRLLLGIMPGLRGVTADNRDDSGKQAFQDKDMCV